mgnify:CR=1 FL=1
MIDGVRFLEKYLIAFSISKINNAIAETLSEVALDTPDKIAAATDEALLNIKGVGKVKLKMMRDYCTGIEVNGATTRLDKVTR